jgi:hypothetical protein
VQRRQDELLVEVLQDVRDAGRQIVVEQDRAGVEILEPERLPLRTSGSSSSEVPFGQIDRRRLGRFPAAASRGARPDRSGAGW